MTPQLRFPEFTDEWQAQKLGSLADGRLSNGVFNDPKKVGSGYKLINVKDMYVDGFIDSASLTKVAISDVEFERNQVKNGDLFFTRSSLVKEGIAYTNIYLGDENDITFDGHLIKLIPDTSKVDHKFMYYLSKSNTARRQLMRYGTTTTMTTIGQKEVADVDVSIPQKPEQQKIADYTGGIDIKLTSIQTKVAAMHEYKKGVMQALFSGKLRFKDEDGNSYPDWQENDFDDVLKSVPSKQYQIQSNEYDPEARYPVVDQGQKLVVSYAGNDDKLFRNGPVIVFGDHTTILKFIDFDFIVGADGTKLLKPKHRDDIKYLYYFLTRKQLIPEGYKRHFSILKDLKISIPAIEEQQKIANFLSALDDKIKLEEAKLASTKEFKKALLQRMFV